MTARNTTRPRLAGALLAVALLTPAAVPEDLRDDDRARPGEAAPSPKPAGARGPAAEWVGALPWRSIGPAPMGGRVVALAVYEADPSTYWVATASGGLLKTVDNGVTFEHQFDHERTVSIGDVCVAPSDRDVVWVGTGENNPRNSVSYGDGVYKSTDGGKTWHHMGLTQSFQIGRIAIHPTNPDVVYVGALGRLWGPNEERGLFKTTNGGRTWHKVLDVDERTGVVDVQMSPADPDTLLVATYERQRDGYDTNDPATKWGPGGGLYQTTDGGRTFRRLARGLPTCALGRIGICYARRDPRTVYAVVESEKIGTGPPRAAAVAGRLGIEATDAEDAGARLTRVTEAGPAWVAGLRPDDVIVAVGGTRVRSYADLVGEIRGRAPGDGVRFKADRAGKLLTFEVTVPHPPAGPPGPAAANAERPFGTFLGGQEENAQDEQGPDGFQTGGVYRSADGGTSWARVNSLNPRPMYFSQIRLDPSDDRRVYVLGIALYRSSDGGRTFREDVRGLHGDQHALWVDPRDGRHVLVGNDGGVFVTYDGMAHWDRLNHAAIGQFYHVAVDGRPLYRVYGGLQDNGVWGGPNRTRTADGPVNQDWVRLAGGDGFVCQVDPADPDLVYYETQWGRFARRDLRTGEAVSLRPPGGTGPGRFTWNSPFLLSHRNPRTFYGAGKVVFRSRDRGDDLRPISPELARTARGSATALAESPRNPDVLWVGTDDGYLWVTRDGGRNWTNVTARVGLPGPRWVAHVEASRSEEGRAYVAFDGHRSDDDEPYVYVTEDHGQTWRSLRGNLPPGPTRVVQEDARNPDLLFLGTEFGAWASLDRGASWVTLNGRLPTVAVHEFAFPASGEVVAATHGRSLWVVDATPLRQMTAAVLRAKVHLFEPAPAVRWRQDPHRGGTSREFVGENPPPGAALYYALAAGAREVRLRVTDSAGKAVRDLPAKTGPGLHRVVWDLTRPPDRPGGTAAPEEAEGVPVPPGTYRVVLTADGRESSQPLRLEPDPAGLTPENDRPGGDRSRGKQP
jgi:photosystem II stability/assembly factor-like uncharacterized protein